MGTQKNETTILNTQIIGCGWIIKDILWGKELNTLPYLDLCFTGTINLGQILNDKESLCKLCESMSYNLLFEYNNMIFIIQEFRCMFWRRMFWIDSTDQLLKGGTTGDWLLVLWRLWKNKLSKTTNVFFFSCNIFAFL